jgi:hypothetical protein
MNGDGSARNLARILTDDQEIERGEVLRASGWHEDKIALEAFWDPDFAAFVDEDEARNIARTLGLIMLPGE